MLAAVRLRHQHADVSTDHLGSLETEQALGRWIGAFDHAASIDRNDRCDG